MPTSVPAMRTGSLPSRGSGMIGLVTNTSSAFATSGTVNASRQPLALSSSTEHRSLDTETLQLTVDLDGAAVACAVPARHRRFPRELRSWTERTHSLEHRRGSAREHAATR